MLSAVVGINWGDEGKGRMVDLLCRNFDMFAVFRAETTPVIRLSTKRANLC